jgi:carbamate kinase
VRDVEVDAAAIQQQISLNLSVCVTHGRGAVVGQLAKYTVSEVRQRIGKPLADARGSDQSRDR